MTQKSDRRNVHFLILSKGKQPANIQTCRCLFVKQEFLKKIAEDARERGERSICVCELDLHKRIKAIVKIIA